MFNLFKKSVPQPPQEVIEAKEAVLETVENKNNYPKEVLEIHHEFSIAAETILIEAKKIIDEASTKDVSKVDRLEKLGFKQANQVTELKPLIQKAKLSKEQVEMAKYYQQKYPNNKFITEEQVQIICHKYNLVCGDVARFKGFVPEKNLREIEKFNLHKEDEIKMLFEVSTDWGVCPLNTIDDSFLIEGHLKYHERSSTAYSFITGDDGIYNNGYFNSKCEIFNGVRYVKVTKKEVCLQICAPVKDMDLTGLKLVDGYKLIKHIPDPVVLQPVKGGHLILTMWADENFDPSKEEILVNQKMN